MNRKTILAILGAVCCTAANAQNGLTSRSLTIEGAYNPTVTKTEKIMPVPDKPESERKAAQVTYLTESNPMQSMQRAPMAAFSETSDDIKVASYSGLVRFGWGLRSVHDGLLDFNWRISDRDELKVYGLMDAWCTKPDGKWKSHMFNGDLDVAYSHRFDMLSLGADASLGHSHFNYRKGADLTAAQRADSKLLQNTGRESLGVWGAGQIDSINWHARIGMEWLSRSGLNLAGTKRDNKERLLRIEGGISMPAPVIGGTAGLEYRQKSAVYDWQGLYGCNYSNFTAVTITPYWNNSWGQLDANLGLNMDFRSAAGCGFLISPMATVTYNVNESLKLLSGVTGGIEDNSMRTLAGVSPYWSESKRIKDGYTLFNAWIGASYSQGTWLTLSGKGGYRHTMDELFQTVSDSLIVTSQLEQGSLDVFYFRVDADMQFAERAQVKMDMTVNGYTGKHKPGQLALKPVLDASLFGKVNIMPGLDAMLTYRMMTMRKVAGKRMPMVNDLAVTVDYDFRPNLSFYVTGSRLAGGDWYYYAGYRSIKPSVMVGATYRF
jgi:hypothetical protein